MISICIPIYNCDVTKLVGELHRQASALDILFEILLIDDASDESVLQINRNLTQLDNVKYQELSVNVGRSAIRNLFVMRASYPYLLFMDNDAQLCSANFIEKYIRIRKAGIICYGGCKYTEHADDNLRLRWLFGIDREAIPIDIRQARSDEYFSTFNFFIDKRILMLHPFDESIKDYGYEDILFRLEVLKQSYHITQIDNPLIHEGLMPNNEFLEKTEISIRNLLQLLSRSDLKPDLMTSIKLLETLNRVEQYKLTSLCSFVFEMTKTKLKKNLLGKNPSLFVFDIYKLGYLCNLIHKNKEC